MAIEYLLTFSDVLPHVPISNNAVIVDFGCGAAAASFEIANQFGFLGHIYAIDIRRDVITRLRNEVFEQGVCGIEPLWGDVDDHDGVPLGDGVVDVVILSHILSAVEKPGVCIAEARRVLKPRGIVVCIDWKYKTQQSSSIELAADSYDYQQVFMNAGYQTQALFTDHTKQAVFIAQRSLY